MLVCPCLKFYSGDDVVSQFHTSLHFGSTRTWLLIPFLWFEDVKHPRFWLADSMRCFAHINLWCSVLQLWVTPWQRSSLLFVLDIS